LGQTALREWVAVYVDEMVILKYGQSVEGPDPDPALNVSGNRSYKVGAYAMAVGWIMFEDCTFSSGYIQPEQAVTFGRHP
jgi:hypothetical protein